MSERKSYGNPFKEKALDTKRESNLSLEELTKWFNKSSDEITESSEKLANQESNVNFWGKAAQWITALGCTAATSGTAIGQCVALGAAIGQGTKMVTDLGDKSEESIPDQYKAISTKYYRDKAPELVDKLNEGVDALETFEENAWKRQILGTASTALDTLKASTMMKSSGLVADEPMFSFDELFSKSPEQFEIDSYNPDSAVDKVLDEFIEPYTQTDEMDRYG